MLAILIHIIYYIDILMIFENLNICSSKTLKILEILGISVGDTF